MDSIISEKNMKEESNFSGATQVWAGGIGFGGGSTDNFSAKKLRDQLHQESIEREYVLIHAFSLFSSAISCTTPK